jgi:hypothetical protein
MTLTLTSIIMLTFPLLWHLYNDRNGDAPSDKAMDILIVSLIAVAAAVIGFFISNQAILDGLILSWALHFFAFDYAINYILYRRGVIENSDWFGYFGKSYTDDVLRQWSPWTRFWIKLGQLIIAIIIYFL